MKGINSLLTQKVKSLPVAFLPVVSIFIIALLMILSGYHNFGAEGIIFNSVQRLLDGLSYLSGPTEIPIALTTYGPIQSWFLYVFSFFLRPSQVIEMGVIFRLVAVAIILFQYFFIVKSYPKLKRSLSLLFFLYISFLPTDLLSLKPDSLSFLFEIIGFVLFQKFIFSKNNKFLAGCSVFLASGFLIKMNTIGVGLGIGLYFLFNKQWKHGLIFSVFILAFVAIFTSFAYFSIGENLLLNLLVSTKSKFHFSWKYLGIVLYNFAVKMIVPICMLGYLCHKSVKYKKIKDPLSFLLPIIATFLLGFLGQFKTGAYLNYFFGMFLVMILMGAHYLEDYTSGEVFGNLLTLSLLIFLVQVVFLCAFTSNRLLNYPWEKVKSSLHQSETTKSKYYIPGNNAVLYFYENSLIGSTSEVFLKVSPGHKDNIPKVKKVISSKFRFSRAVIVGSNCSSWEPSGIFYSEVSHLSELDFKEKNICVFRPRQKE